MDALKISPKYTADDWARLDLEDPATWPVAADITRDRLDGRFVRFGSRCLRFKHSGFVVLAIDSLLAETIQQFKEGIKGVKGEKRPSSGELIAQFLSGQRFQPDFDPIARSVTPSDHAPTAGQTAQGTNLTDAANHPASCSPESHGNGGNPPENAGFLATLLRPSGHRGGQKMSRRNVGEIIKRGRIYYIRYYDVKGRRRLETTKSTDRNEAEKQLRKRLSAKDAGVSPDAAIGKLTLKEATDDLLNDYKVNGRRLPEVQRKIELHLLPSSVSDDA